MKKIINIGAALLLILFSFHIEAAEVPQFEGTVLVKTFASQSKRFLQVYPYYYSGVDTCEITIKGDMIHEYFHCNQVHKIIRDGRIIYYSDLTKTGFDIPFALMSASKTTYNTNELRTYAGMECTVEKTSVLNPYGITEITGWVTDNVYNISEDAIRYILSSFTTNFKHDYNGRMCLKSTLSFSLTGMGKAIIGSVGHFLSYEVIGFERHEVAENTFAAPASIKIKNIPQSSLNISLLEASYELMDKSIKEAGTTKQDLVDTYIFSTNEKDLLTKHKSKLKKQQKKAQDQDIVTFDIDDEWNY